MFQYFFRLNFIIKFHFCHNFADYKAKGLRSLQQHLQHTQLQFLVWLQRFRQRTSPPGLTTQYPTVPMPPVNPNRQPGVPIDYYQQMRQQQVYHGIQSVTGSQQFSDGRLFGAHAGYQQQIVVTQASYIHTGSAFALAQQTPLVHPVSVVQPTSFMQPPGAIQPISSVQGNPFVQPATIMPPTQIVQPTGFMQPQAVIQPTSVMQPSAVMPATRILQGPQVVQPTHTIQQTQRRPVTQVIQLTQVPQTTTSMARRQTMVQPQVVQTTAQPITAVQVTQVLQTTRSGQDIPAIEITEVLQPTTPTPSDAAATVTEVIAAQTNTITSASNTSPMTTTATTLNIAVVPIVQQVATTTNTVSQVQEGQPLTSPMTQNVRISQTTTGAPIYTTANTLPSPSSAFLERTPQQQSRQQNIGTTLTLDARLTSDDKKHLTTARLRGRNVAISSLPQMYEANEPENPTISLRYCKSIYLCAPYFVSFLEFTGSKK